jgi:MinD superfamily P-loop ATPase
MRKPFGVVVNRNQGSFMPLKDYLEEENIPLLMALPESRRIAESYSRGEVIIKNLPDYRDNFADLITKIIMITGKDIMRKAGVSNG